MADVELRALLRARFEAIPAESPAIHERLAFHEAQPALDNGRHRGRRARRTGHNLLCGSTSAKTDVLRFLYELRVPFTNNQDECDGRMMQLRQKISGCFRSSEGTAKFATLRSFLPTAQKQGWRILDTLIRGMTQPLRMA